MTELAQIGRMAGVPLVVLKCESKTAGWYGRYFLNIGDSSDLRRGPYDSVDEACKAIEATGRFRRRIPEPASGPHFDPIWF